MSLSYNSDLPADLDINLFSDIADGELLTATQLIESNCGISVQFVNPEFSDISDDELLLASSTVDLALENKPNECVEINPLDEIQFSDISDEEFVKLPLESIECNRFRNPVSSNDMGKIVSEKFAKRTIDKSTWAVSLFGQWRADRNVRCLSDKSLVYIDKPFGLMTDDEIIYTKLR